MRLTSDQRDWNELGKADPYWAILSLPGTRHGRWRSEDFFATGPPDIAAALERFEALPSPRYGRALDFGCGVGRLTRALATPFDHVTGVDISETMVQGARTLNSDVPGVDFVVNDRDDLREVAGDRSMDLVFSQLALQHVSSKAAIESYLREFVRVLRPGGLIAFQLPSRVTLLKRLQPKRRHAYHALRGLGVPAGALNGRLRLHPMAMRHLEVGKVCQILTDAGATVISTQSDPPRPVSGYLQTRYYATR